MLNGEIQSDEMPAGGGDRGARQPTAHSHDEERADAKDLEAHLILERLGGCEALSADEQRRSTVPLPKGGLWLGTDDAGNPRVIEDGKSIEDGVAAVPVGNNLFIWLPARWASRYGNRLLGRAQW